MGPLDALWHLLNFLAPALGVGLIATLLAKLVWGRALKAPLGALLLWSCGAAAAALVAGLVLGGRDGRMSTYGAVVLAVSLALWWRGGLARR